MSNLFECPDCGKEISKSAICCPNCGHPVNSLNAQNKTEEVDKNESNTDIYYNIANSLAKPIKLSLSSSLYIGGLVLCVLIIAFLMHNKFSINSNGNTNVRNASEINNAKSVTKPHVKKDVKEDLNPEIKSNPVDQYHTNTADNSKWDDVVETQTKELVRSVLGDSSVSYFSARYDVDCLTIGYTSKKPSSYEMKIVLGSVTTILQENKFWEKPFKYITIAAYIEVPGTCKPPDLDCIDVLCEYSKSVVREVAYNSGGDDKLKEDERCIPDDF